MKTKWDLRLVVSIFIFIATVGAETMSCYLWGKKQIDFHVYYSAALAFREGLNPYDSANLARTLAVSGSNPYNYPPDTLFLYLPLTYFSLATAARIFLTVKLGAIAMLIYVWNRIFDFMEYLFLVFLITPLAFNAALLDDLQAGNISVFEQLFIWMGFYYYSRDKITWFAVAVILASLFKLVTILLLLLLVTRIRRNDILCMIAAGACFMSLLALNGVFWPHLFAGFVANMINVSGADRGDLNPATLVVIKDTATWFALKSGHALPLFLPYVAYMVLCMATIYVAGLVFAKLRMNRTKQADLWRICLICFLYAVLMPRLKNYSYIVLIAPALYAILSRPLAKAWVPFCMLLIIYTYREYTVLGTALAPYFRLQAEYYSLCMAWIVSGLFCYSFLREPPGETGQENDSALHARLESSEKPDPAL